MPRSLPARAVACFLTASALFLSGRPAAGGVAADKIDPWVLDQLVLAPSGESEFLIVLAEQADLSGAAALRDQARQGALRLRDSLRATAARTQAPLLDELARAGVVHRPFWIANFVWAKGDATALASIAARPDVARIAANPRVAEAGPFVGRRPGVELRPRSRRVEHHPGQRAAGLGAGLHRPGRRRRRAGHRLRLGPSGAPGQVPRLERRRRRPRLQLARRDPLRRRHLRRQRRCALRRQRATAPTRWGRWSATTAAPTRSAWRRAPGGSAAATWIRATAPRRPTPSATSGSWRRPTSTT